MARSSNPTIGFERRSERFYIYTASRRANCEAGGRYSHRPDYIDSFVYRHNRTIGRQKPTPTPQWPPHPAYDEGFFLTKEGSRTNHSKISFRWSGGLNGFSKKEQERWRLIENNMAPSYTRVCCEETLNSLRFPMLSVGRGPGTFSLNWCRARPRVCITRLAAHKKVDNWQRALFFCFFFFFLSISPVSGHGSQPSK